jgi:hypothetical protein
VTAAFLARTGSQFTVMDPEGRVLSTATFVYDAGRLCFRESPGDGGRLARYHEQHPEGEAILVVRGLPLRGTLSPFWNGSERLWRLTRPGRT